MAKYLKLFNEMSQYETFKDSEEYILPNVSYIVDSNEVKYSGGDFIIMTSESNPEVMKVCYNQGWAESPYEMYASEAARVTSIGTAFQDLGQGSSNDYGYSGYNSGYSGYGSSNTSFTFTFDEFKYFTGVTFIDYYAFSNSGLYSIIIPDSVTEICNSAFDSCLRLTSINIPDSVTSIGGSAFENCISLPIEGNIRYADTYLVKVFDPVYASYNIKEGTKFIGKDAFSYCSHLNSINIPDSVTYIGHRAFENCYKLSSVYIGTGVTYIGEYVFTSCSELSEITCNAMTAPTICYSTFSSVKSGGILKVPAESDYSSWMSNSLYYLGYYNWTCQGN